MSAGGWAAGTATGRNTIASTGSNAKRDIDPSKATRWRGDSALGSCPNDGGLKEILSRPADPGVGQGRHAGMAGGCGPCDNAGPGGARGLGEGRTLIDKGKRAGLVGPVGVAPRRAETRGEGIVR